MFARRRVTDAAISGQLISFLAVFAPALTVALSSQAAIPTARFPRQPQREGQVDKRADGVDSLGVLLRPASGQQYHPLTSCDSFGEVPDPRGRHGGQLLDTLRSVASDDAFHFREAGRPARDVVV